MYKQMTVYVNIAKKQINYLLEPRRRFVDARA